MNSTVAAKILVTDKIGPFNRGGIDKFPPFQAIVEAAEAGKRIVPHGVLHRGLKGPNEIRDAISGFPQKGDEWNSLTEKLFLYPDVGKTLGSQVVIETPTTVVVFTNVPVQFQDVKNLALLTKCGFVDVKLGVSGAKTLYTVTFKDETQVKPWRDFPTENDFVNSPFKLDRVGTGGDVVLLLRTQKANCGLIVRGEKPFSHNYETAFMSQPLDEPYPVFVVHP